MNRFSLALAVAMLLLGARASSADIVYTSGPINGTIQAYDISGNDYLSNSFTVSSPATLTSALVGLWSKDIPTSVDWSIGTTAFGSNISSGSGATLTNLMVGETSTHFTVYSSTFLLNSPPLADGTYWFTLHGATSATDGTVYWDENNSAGKESFTLFDSAVPEPSRAAGLFGLAGMGIFALAWRRRR